MVHKHSCCCVLVGITESRIETERCVGLLKDAKCSGYCWWCSDPTMPRDCWPLMTHEFPLPELLLGVWNYLCWEQLISIECSVLCGGGNPLRAVPAPEFSMKSAEAPVATADHVFLCPVLLPKYSLPHSCCSSTGTFLPQAPEWNLHLSVWFQCLLPIMICKENASCGERRAVSVKSN